MDWSESMVSAANEMFLVVIPESPISRSAHFGSGTRTTRIPLAKKESITWSRSRLIQSTPDSDTNISTFVGSYCFVANLGEGGKKLVVTFLCRIVILM